MKVSDIEAVLKKYGDTLLKDTNPELFQAELSAGPSTVFLPRTLPMAPDKDSASTSNAGKSSIAADEHAADE